MARNYRVSPRANTLHIKTPVFPCSPSSWPWRRIRPAHDDGHGVLLGADFAEAEHDTPHILIDDAEAGAHENNKQTKDNIGRHGPLLSERTTPRQMLKRPV
jgi:hypothetical protein